ncbi:uncharacterized protein LOC144174236 [Haemaphysalis longicornis]
MSRVRWELLYVMADEAYHVVCAVADFRTLVKACVSGDRNMSTAVDVLASSCLLVFHVLVLGPRRTMTSEAMLFVGDMLLHYFHMLLSSWQLSHYLWTARKREAHQFYLLWASFLLHTAMVWHYSGGIQVTIRLQFDGGQEENAPPPQPPGAPPAPNNGAIVAAQAAEAAAAHIQPPANDSGRSPPQGSIAGHPRSTSLVEETPPDACGELRSSATSTSDPPPPATASCLDSARDPDGALPAVSEDHQRFSSRSDSETSLPDYVITGLPASETLTLPATPTSLSTPPMVPFRESLQYEGTQYSEGEGFDDMERGEPPVDENVASIPARTPGMSSTPTPEPRANDVTKAAHSNSAIAVEQGAQNATTAGDSPKPAPDIALERVERHTSSNDCGQAASSREETDRHMSHRTPVCLRPVTGSDAVPENGETCPSPPLHSGPDDIVCPTVGFSPPSQEGHNGDAVQAYQHRELSLVCSTDSAGGPSVATAAESAQSSRSTSADSPPNPNIS